MRSLGDIIRSNARKAGKDALAYTVYVIVDPVAVRDSVEPGDERAVEQIVADEIDSNLAGLDYVDDVKVRRKIL